MEDFDKVKENVRGFLTRKLKIPRDEKNIELTLEKLDGLSNTNYLVTVTRKTTNEKIIQIVYRKFGEISDVVDRDLETMIINNLAGKGIGPKILDRDEQKKTFRIDEYLANTTPIPKSDQFDSVVLDQIITIANSYSLISTVYKYKVENVNGYSINISPIDTASKTRETYRVNQNMFNMCTKDMYEKAYQAFNVFAEEFRAHYKKEDNKTLYANFEKFEHYMKNYPEIFTKVWPEEGFMILNHNDVHRLNLIVRKEDKKLFILDHEYASLNLIGNDIANYMNESNFTYTPEYTFSPDEIDFDFYYESYKKYIEGFKKQNIDFVKSDEGKKWLETISTKKYYINLHAVLNIFWLLYCAIYLNFAEEFKENVSFSYFQHGIDRIVYFERALARIQNEN